MHSIYSVCTLVINDYDIVPPYQISYVRPCIVLFKAGGIGPADPATARPMSAADLKIYIRHKLKNGDFRESSTTSILRNTLLILLWPMGVHRLHAANAKKLLDRTRTDLNDAILVYCTSKKLNGGGIWLVCCLCLSPELLEKNHPSER